MRVKLPFLAAVPVGHQVLVQWTQRPGVFSGWNEAEPVVLDRDTGIVWGDSSLPETLDQNHFAIEKHDTELRPSRPTTEGRVLSCQVVTRGSGKYNLIQTILVLEVAGEPSGGPFR